jgi:hypothetical protein
MARFGPTIWDEIIAAGLGGEAISIEGDDVILGSRFPADKRPVLEVVIGNHDPNKQKAVPAGPVQTAIQALIDEGLIPANKVQAILNRVKGK